MPAHLLFLFYSRRINKSKPIQVNFELLKAVCVYDHYVLDLFYKHIIYLHSATRIKTRVIILILIIRVVWIVSETIISYTHSLLSVLKENLSDTRL